MSRILALIYTAERYNPKKFQLRLPLAHSKRKSIMSSHSEQFPLPGNQVSKTISAGFWRMNRSSSKWTRGNLDIEHRISKGAQSFKGKNVQEAESSTYPECSFVEFSYLM